MERNALKISKESVDRLFPKKDIDILGYESPINVVMGQMRMEQENNIFKAIQEYGVNVDKDELIKALQYDRNQYEKGYINGYNTKASEVAREIFEEIDKNSKFTIQFVEAMEFDNEEIRKAKLECYRDCLGYFQKLKKKYTESENNNE